MRNRLLHSLFASTLVVAISLASLTSANAQLSMGSAEVLALIDHTVIVLADTTGSVTVDVGSSGIGQTWDLSGIVLQGETLTQQYVEPANTPYAADFPGANFAVHITTDLDVEFEFYQYADVTAGAYQDLGGALIIGDTTEFSFDAGSSIPLPVEFNSTWSEVSRDTTEGEGFRLISVDSSSVLVDGWGTLILAAGSFNALRLQTNDLFISSTYVNDVLIASDTIRTIGYDWLTENALTTASAYSQDGETDPNFTNAGSVQIAIAFSVGVDDLSRLHAEALVRSVYPNPFAETIAIEVAAQGRQPNATVHDILGRRIRTLETGIATDGITTIVWDGRTDAGAHATNGVYFIRVQDGDRTEARKVVIVR
jgi:hypothetical protein